MIPAFSAAIPVRLLPRNSWWSIEMEVMAQAAGRSMTLVESAPAAEPDLQDAEIGRFGCEKQEGGGGDDLEYRYRRAGIDPLHRLQRLCQRHAVHQPAAKPDALVEIDQMGRGEDLGTQTGGLADGAREGTGTTLAVGAGHMQHRRQSPFGMAKLVQEHPQPRHVEVDRARVEAQQPLQHAIDARVLAAFPRALRHHRHGRHRLRQAQDPSL